jgi:LacI family transcriptional regulator
VDVAKAAGVSVSTVSRVINDKDDVSNDTYRHVSQIIRELGYTSSLAAKSMRSRKTGVIGLIMPNVDDPFSVEVMRGVSRAIVELDYDLLIYTNGDIKLNNSATREQQYVTLLNSSLTDGAIIVTPVASEFPSVSPVVSVDPNVNSPSGPAVISTNYHGAREAIDYLIGLGHRRIGFISGRTDLLSAVRRRMAFEDAHKDAGLTLDPDLVRTGDYTYEVAYQEAISLLALDDPPTAIFASNDQSAKGVYKAAEERGIRIPDDLSVVGYDNIPEAKYMGLTTVDQQISQMGYIGTQMLYTLIQGDELDVDIFKIDSRLIVRGSCKAV